MAQAVYGSSIAKVFGEQVSLTTTAAHLLFKPNYHEVKMYCASDWRMGIAPKLASVQYYLASGTSYTDYTTQATDRVDATHVPLDGMVATDILYLGTTEPVRGFYFNIGANVNAEAATLDVEYMSALSSGVATFTDVASDSDGTTSAGATLAQDGVYTFTLLTAGTVKKGIISALNQTAALYWYRFKPSATLSATVDLVDIIPICDTTSYGYMQGGTEYNFSINQSGQGAFEFDHASSDTLNITWLRH